MDAFTVKYWTNVTVQAKTVWKDRSVRINGEHFMIGDDVPNPSQLKGHGGARFQIKFHDGRVVETTNLWHQGEIPKEFKDKLPDNADFVK